MKRRKQCYRHLRKRQKRKAGDNSGNDRPISVSARSCSLDNSPPRREDEAEQIKSGHEDAVCLLESDPRGAGKRGKDQDIGGYRNIGENNLMALMRPS